MTVKIWVISEEVEIPNESLLPLAQSFRENFGLEPDAPVYLRELLREGVRQGIIHGLPGEEWDVDRNCQEPLNSEKLQVLAEWRTR